MQKIKYLCIRTETENLVLEGNREVETCKEYEYLGTTLNKKGINNQEINKKVRKARRIIVPEWDLMKQKQKEEIRYI